MEIREERVTVMVSFYNLLRDKLGTDKQEVTLEEGSTVGDLLDQIRELYGNDIADYIFEPSGELKSYIRIARSGASPQERKDAPLSDGDEMYMFVAIAGG